MKGSAQYIIDFRSRGTGICAFYKKLRKSINEGKPIIDFRKKCPEFGNF
jgi:hypothetical protein